MGHHEGSAIDQRGRTNSGAIDGQVNRCLPAQTRCFVTSTLSHLSGVPGLLSAEQIAVTARYLAQLQTEDGQIPWFPKGHCDPWNHVEAAMALTVTGFEEEARAAYRWLVTTQLGDGSWFNYYQGRRVKDTRLDTNVCAYLATGIFHYVLVTDDLDFAAEVWPSIQRAIDF